LQRPLRGHRRIDRTRGGGEPLRVE
jgi:hypothetical protein